MNSIIIAIFQSYPYILKHIILNCYKARFHPLCASLSTFVYLQGIIMESVLSLWISRTQTNSIRRAASHSPLRTGTMFLPILSLLPAPLASRRVDLQRASSSADGIWDSLPYRSPAPVPHWLTLDYLEIDNDSDLPELGLTYLAFILWSLVLFFFFFLSIAN